MCNKEYMYCRKCGGFVDYDKSYKLLSCPAQYKGICKDCGSITSEICDIVDGDVVEMPETIQTAEQFNNWVDTL